MARRDWFYEIEVIQRDIGRFLEEVYQRKPPSHHFLPKWQPSIDVYEAPDKFIVLAELAGVKEGEIEVVVDGTSLILRGERRETPELRRGEERRCCYQLEIYWGPFERVIPLPSPIDPDKTTATFYNGILEIVLPKSSKEVQIKVKG